FRYWSQEVYLFDQVEQTQVIRLTVGRTFPAKKTPYMVNHSGSAGRFGELVIVYEIGRSVATSGLIVVALPVSDFTSPEYPVGERLPADGERKADIPDATFDVFE
ncbi:MAG: hypothetical protein WB627_16520, partial [Candidatus Acidiferrum sp.]